MKHEYRKHEKSLYGTKTQPVLLDVAKQRYICIKGTGNPNSTAFTERVAALYALAYAIRMMPKTGFTPPGYFEYTVYPLEGLWDLNAEGRQATVWNKDHFVYTLMIRQPDFVDEQIFERALNHVRKRKPQPLLDELFMQQLTDGLSVQMLHLGSYDDEATTFAAMKAYIETHNLAIKTLVHREIYLSDPRKTQPEKLKTLLRYRVERI